MGVDIEGLDELEEQLNQLADLEGGVPMEELFTQEFMLMYTDFNSFEEFIETSQWTVESQEDFEAIPEDAFDDYVDEHTEFAAWEPMLRTGAERYLQRKLEG